MGRHCRPRPHDLPAFFVLNGIWFRLCALAGWLRASLVIALVGTLIGVSYFADVLSSLLKLPDWVVSLSIFHQYGAPLIEGPRWLSWLALVDAAAALAIVGAFRFTRQDIHQGA